MTETSATTAKIHINWQNAVGHKHNGRKILAIRENRKGRVVIRIASDIACGFKDISATWTVDANGEYLPGIIDVDAV